MAVRVVHTFALGLAVALAGCSDAGPGDGSEQADDAADSLRLGRVHVVLEPSGDEDTEAISDAFEVTARFALVRGLDEDFVRARADIPYQPEEVLGMGQCGTDEVLWPEGDASDDGEGVRELVLVDAGELEVDVADERIQVPLSLVPDLLPYMSGVEYVYFGDQAPAADLLLDASVSVRAAGGFNDELPAFAVEGGVPSDLGLFATAEDLSALSQDALVLRWDGAEATAPIALRITPMTADKPGDDLYCVVADRGQTRLDLSELRALGLPADADEVHVTASRTSFTMFDAGEFAGSELVVERRASLDLPLR